MPRQLPSLNALRAFEAAARRLSFTRAADELFVTQAAVSHQIKHLEEQLGMQLFRRMNRQLQLTDAGQILMPFMSDALDMMASGIERLNHEQRFLLTGKAGGFTRSVYVLGKTSYALRTCRGIIPAVVCECEV